MWLYQVPVDQMENIIGAVGFILIMGVVWLVIRTVFKLAMKVFMMGCAVILFFGVIAMAASYIVP